MSVLLVIYPHTSRTTEELRSQAMPIIAPGTEREPGKNQARMDSYYAGRAAVAAGLQRLGVRGAKVRPDPFFGYLVVDGAKIQTNVSHTQGLAVAVLSAAPVGVDVERIDRDASRVMGKAANPKERARVAGAAVDVEGRMVPAPLALWSAKEAFSKAVGLGIKFGMQRLEIDLDLRTARTDLKGPLRVPEPTVTFITHGNYLISVVGPRGELACPPSRLVLD